MLPIWFFLPLLLLNTDRMSEVPHDNWKNTGFIDYYVTEETAAVNVSTERLID